MRQPAIDPLPLRVRNDAGNQVERKQTFRAPPVAVHGERDSLDQKRKVGVLPALLELRWHHGSQLFENLGIMRAWLIRGREHLVVERPDLIIPEQPLKRHF